VPVTGTRICDVRTIGGPVRDQDRALEFYLDVLGFDKRLEVTYGAAGAGRWIEVAPSGARTTIALVLGHDGVTAGVETGIRLVTTDADVDHASLVGHGVDCDDVLRWPGVPPMFAFRDQDGNSLELVEQA
jgi:catechol 2,3-dioxygenase-like lactoylglutathione lyase family enzyme